MAQVWQTWQQGSAYAVQWREGETAADIVSGLPEHAPDGGLDIVGHVDVPGDLLAQGPAAVVLGLPGVLADWQGHENEVFAAFRKLADVYYQSDRDTPGARGATRAGAAAAAADAVALVGKYPADGPDVKRWVQAYLATARG